MLVDVYRNVEIYEVNFKIDIFYYNCENTLTHALIMLKKFTKSNHKYPDLNLFILFALKTIFITAVYFYYVYKNPS